jgi:lipopolysaccharide export system permease protein
VPRTLVLRIAREVLAYGALATAVLAMVFLSENLRRYLGLIVAVDFAPADIGALATGLIGIVASYILPITFLLGVLLTVGRMAADSEITAMRACGIGVRSILLPIVGLGALMSVVSWMLVVDVEHRARRELREVVRSMAARGATLEPGRFRHVGPRVLYAEDRLADETLEGVVISDRSNPERPLLIFARRGRIDLDEEGAKLRVTLEEGDILVDPIGEQAALAQHIGFASFETVFDVSELFRVGLDSLRPYDMTLEELRSITARADSGDPLDDLIKKQGSSYEVEMHRRFAVPFAPLLFAPVGVVLGMRRRRGARATGVILCALVAFGYYALLIFGQRLGVEGRLPAFVALWIPNLIFAGIGLAMLEAMRRRRG